MRDNDKLIEQARLRQIHGHTKELDEWPLRAAGRREEKTMHQNDGSNAAEWADWTQDQIQRYFEETIVPGWGEALGQMRAEAREEFTSRIHKLEVELAEMRGELKGLREARQMVTSEPSQ